MKWSSLVLVALAMCSTGCTQTQLRTNTVRKAETLNDIYQQQVLDNLAKFIVDPNSLPHFAIPSQGTSAVNDSLASDGGLTWNSTILNGARLNGGGSRQMQENWVLTPVSDPRKLERMRCAYQMVVSRCGFCTLGSCPDNQQVLNKFYTGSAADSSWMAKNDRVSTQCLIACEPWFGRGKKRDIPKECDCLLVGRYCDQYVWVAPRCHDQLAKLTLCMLDFAINDSPKGPVKTVKLFLAQDGTATTEEHATQVVETVVPTNVDDVSNLSVSNPPKGSVKPKDSKLFDASEMLDNRGLDQGIRAVPLLEFNERLRALGQ
jgi:hypothetical protein